MSIGRKREGETTKERERIRRKGMSGKEEINKKEKKNLAPVRSRRENK